MLEGISATEKSRVQKTQEGRDGGLSGRKQQQGKRGDKRGQKAQIMQGLWPCKDFSYGLGEATAGC